ncbi:MAG: glycosyltransferase [Candidatus Woesebacteria bacterium]|nr:MAG: glycosyltransferase [Candidatus Woesebacteria bacterium]
MNVSIVIPNWNGRNLLEKNLPNVLEAKENKKNNIKEIIIVDDSSTDSSVDFLKINFKKKIKLIVLKTNRGFASAVNTGVRTSTGELVCLLNTDVIPEKNFLQQVVLDFEDKKIFAVSLHEKGFGSAKGSFVNGFFEHSGEKEQNKLTQSLWASGGSACFRRNLWIQLKGFDEILFSPFYWEDVDLSYRAQKRGYKVLWEPKANVVHKHESVINTNNFKARKLNLIKQRNYLIFIWKNITSKALLKKHKFALFARIKKHPGYIRIVFLALLRLRQIQKARKIEKQESSISDESIFEKFSK